MPSINLKVKDKQTIGDGTKIVCNNKDYTAWITFEDCPTLVNLPVKKLVVKYGTEYDESLIKTVTAGDGTTTYQATLPPIKGHPYADIGIVGKEKDDPTEDPKFSSKPARFECDKSIMCGALILQHDPVLTDLKVKENGKYSAVSYGADGFYEVNVNVVSKSEEERTVALMLADGDQVVLPSGSAKVMKQVTVQKPMNLLPEFIKHGVNIAGVVGTFDNTFIEKEITSNGEYSASLDGADGYSKVTVNVGAPSSEEKSVVPQNYLQEVVPTEAEYLSKVIVDPIPSEYVIPSGTITITANGTHSISGYAYAEVTVGIGADEDYILELLMNI